MNKIDMYGELIAVQGNKLVLSENELMAITNLRAQLNKIAAVSSLIVFGSVARGEAGPDSDLDVLVVFERELTYEEETQAYDAVYRANVEFDTNVSIVVVDEDKWQSPVWSRLPLYQVVRQEGIPVHG
jgi:predicted nucleotidyltransferase